MEGFLSALVPTARLLYDLPSLVEKLRLPFDLVFDRALDGTERVQVLHFDFRTESRAHLRDTDVRFDAHLPFLEIRVRCAERAKQELQLAREIPGSLRVMNDGFGDELHERHACAIEIDFARAPSLPSSFTSLPSCEERAVSSSR
jgi:hypothetical protein